MSTLNSFNFSDMILKASVEELMQIYSVIAETAVTNNSSFALNPAKYKANAEAQNKLVLFWLENNIQPIPLPEALVIVYRNDLKPTILPEFVGLTHKLSAVGLGTQFITAKEVVDKGKTYLKGVEKKLKARIQGGSGSKITSTPYEPTSHKDLPRIYADQFANWFALFITEQMAGLPAEKFAELANIIRPKSGVADAELTVNKPNNIGFVVDFASLEIACNSSEGLKVAKRSIGYGHHKADSKVALLSLALQMADPNFGSIAGKLNKVPNLLKREPNYGVQMDSTDPSEILMNETETPLNAALRDETESSLRLWPWFVIENANFDPNIIDSYMESEGAVITDKYAMKSIGGAVAAAAALIGRRKRVLADGSVVDEILTPHDVGSPNKIKESKALNRPMQARKHLKADLKGRERSLFEVLLPDGRLSAQWGLPLKTVLTNSRLCLGSGPAIVRQGNDLFNIVVGKTDSIKVIYDRLSKVSRRELESLGGEPGNKSKGMEVLRDEILQKIEELSAAGRVFAPGEVMLEVRHRVYLRNRTKNQHLRLNGIKRVADFSDEKSYKSDSVRIFIKTEMVASTSWGKLRNDGFKLTTIPYPVKFEDGYSDWDILLNLETQKGKLCQTILFVVANGGGVYHPNSGELVMNDKTKFPNPIDLTAIHNGVTVWVRKNMVERKLTMDIAKAEWEIIAACHPTDDMEVVDHGDYATVTETIQTLSGVQYYEYEISTAYENTGNSAMTLEQLAGVSLQSRKLAEAIYKENDQYRESVMSLMDMITATPKELAKYPHVELFSPSGRKDLQAKVGSLDGLTDRQILDRYKRAFPGGVVFCSRSSNAESSGISKLYLNFEVVSSMSTFIGGAADQIAEDIVAFLNYLCNLDDKSIDSAIQGKVSLLRTSMRSWLDNSIKSKKILQRAARTGRFLSTGKVRTSYDPILNHKIGELPKAGFNPNCPVLRDMATHSLTGKVYQQYLDAEGNFCPELMNGVIICASRSPMIMLGALQVVVTKNVEVGHMLVLPSIWSQLHEGDSDGDGFASLNAEVRGLTLEEALQMNEEVTGMAGYSLVYGEDPAGWPYADFCSLPDKVGKKAIVPPEEHLQPYVLAIPAEKFAEMSKNVNDHYRGPVGTTYGICSVAVFQAADMVYARDKGLFSDNLLTLFKQTNAVGWRLMYEGLGLAGYSKEAKRFFDVLRIYMWNDNFIEINGELKFPEKNQPNKDLKSCKEELVSLAKIGHMTYGKQVMGLVKLLGKHCVNRSAMEYGLERVQYLTPQEKVESAVWTGLRAAGQGLNKAGVVELENADSIGEEDYSAQSVFTVLNNAEGWKKLNCWWLAEVLQNSTYIHQTVARRLHALMNEDEG